MTESRPAIIIPAFPRASKEVRVRALSVMLDSKTDRDVRCQMITQCCAKLHGSVEAVTGVAEARDDVPVLVESLVERTQDDGDVAPFRGLLEGRKTFGGG